MGSVFSPYYAWARRKGATNPDGSVVVVAMNRTEHALPFTLNLGPRGAPFALPARSITSLLLP